MSREELDLQYSPSRWSKRYSADEVIVKHIEFSTTASEEAKTSVPCELGIPYGEEEREKFDVFGTDLPDDSPIFVYIHGGYWQELSRELSSYVVKPFYKHNFKVIVLGYTLCPQVTLPELVNQIKKGFKKCLEIASTKGSRGLYIAGHSAGAHLIASLLDEFLPSLPINAQRILKGLFLISGVFNLIPLVNTYVNDPLKLTEDTARQLSPLFFNFSRKMECQVPIYVIIGQHDSPAFKEQSKLFNEKLKDSGFNTTVVKVSGVDHFDIVERLNDEDYEVGRLITNLSRNN